MKFIKFSAILAFATVLSACGGHDYEGVYETRAGSNNELLNSFVEMAGGEKLVIGSDYIESQGKRTLFDEIFERESAGEHYLVFKTGETEEGWKIVDKNTLMQGGGLMSIKLVRVD